MVLVRPLCILIILFTVVLVPIISSKADAICHEKIDLPQGSRSYADSVLLYTPGAGPYSPYDYPISALGIADNQVVSLGLGGTLILRFEDNSLIASGDYTEDLWIFECGHDEPTDVFISIDQQAWISVGQAAGGTSGIDIDSFSDVTSGQKYSYVKLIDKNLKITPDGADIDAVGAYSSSSAFHNTGTPVAPEPVSTFLFIVGGATLGLRRFFIRKKSN